uniref:Carbonyl reductase 1 n=1 Tax=Corethron hystrix TaxID=216773 RepID=A0A7S1BED2_9STRA
MDAFLPAMERTGSRPRCVNVCSMAGKLGRYPPHMKQRFVGAVRDRDQDQLKRLVEDFIADVETDTYAQKGWPRQTYGISKAAEIASTFVAAEEYGHGENPIFVAACCPGWCRTDMAGPRAPKSAEEGADTPFWLACENSSVVGAMHKRFVQNRQELAWGE